MKPKKYTETELKEMALIADGKYQFEVMEVHDTDKYNTPLVDRSGNAMSKLKLKIWDNNGRERFVYTNLFADGKMVFRTRHYADSIGAIDLYEAEKFDTAETLGATGWCEVITRKGNPKNDGSGELWPDSNDVKDFIKMSDQVKLGNKGLPPVHNAAEAPFNDDLPF